MTKKLDEGYGAVVASTGGSLKIDLKRADDAIKRIKEVYGSINSYPGFWVAAGSSRNLDDEPIQRTNIYNHFLEAGAKRDKVITLDGIDTMDKTRNLISLSEKEKIERIGISTYLLHFLRFKEGLIFAKNENLAPKSLEFGLIWSPTTPWTRWHIDIIYGVAGLGLETFRLMRKGFSGSTPEYKPFERFSDPLRKMGSDETGLDQKDNEQ